MRLERTLLEWLATVGGLIPAPNPISEAYPDLPGWRLHGDSVLTW
jgi:hypothetical protein